MKQPTCLGVGYCERQRECRDLLGLGATKVNLESAHAVFYADFDGGPCLGERHQPGDEAVAHITKRTNEVLALNKAVRVVLGEMPAFPAEKQVERQLAAPALALFVPDVELFTEALHSELLESRNLLECRYRLFREQNIHRFLLCLLG